MERLAAAVKLQDEEVMLHEILGQHLSSASWTLFFDDDAVSWSHLLVRVHVRVRVRVHFVHPDERWRALQVIKLATSEQKMREDDDVDSSALDEGFAAAVASLGGVGAGGEKAWGDASGSEEVSEEDGLSELFDDGEGGEEDPAMQKWREIFD
eukprot:260531-Rhodomonas_salina.1